MYTLTYQKFLNEKLLWVQNFWNQTFQNEFYFSLVKVMTKFEKILKNDYHYIRLYKRKTRICNLKMRKS